MEGDVRTAGKSGSDLISIHSLRMEGDSGIFCCAAETIISIHSLRMEGDANSTIFRSISPTFQSTPSAWRETNYKWCIFHEYRHFNPLPPHGGRPQVRLFTFRMILYFNPLPPHGGRPWSQSLVRKRMHFNPLPPHGGRPFALPAASTNSLFQSTPSAWRETLPVSVSACWTTHFNPLPPHGGRPYYTRRTGRQCNISIHSLRMEGDSKTAQESVFHFAYPCTILQKRMQKTTFCTRKNGFFRKKGEKFGAKPSASFCAPMIRTDTFPLNFSHRISGSSMSMVSFAPICSTFD